MDNINTSGCFQCRDLILPLKRKTYIMGILNVTPDSFSDGGRFNDVETAVRRAREMIVEGADIIDIGGESTRPGHVQVGVMDEINRVVPVIEKLSGQINIPISIDTSKAEVAEKALMAGAHIVNDVWGLQRDKAIAGVAARFGAGVVMMHNQETAVYTDLMSDIKVFLEKSIRIAEQAGIDRDRMIIDPGVGFGKTLEHNLEVIKRLSELETLKLPVLLGTSRKSMIGKVLNLPENDRVEGTAATVAIGITYGADFIRVHDVWQIARVVKMSDAIIRGHG